MTIDSENFLSAEKRRYIQSLLDASPVKPNGKAQVFKYNHKSTNFTVVSCEPYSKEAIRLFDKEFSQRKKQMARVLIEEQENQVPEVQFAHHVAIEQQKPISTVIISPYNAIIAQHAHLDFDRAIEAIMVNKLLREGANTELLTAQLAQSFELPISAIQALAHLTGTKLDQNREETLSAAKQNLSQLTRVANDLSWSKLQDLKLQGEILVLVNNDQAGIFSKFFIPAEIYTEREREEIELRIRLLKERTDETRQTARDGVYKLIERITEKDYHPQEINQLEMILDKNPNDIAAKRRLKDLVTSTITKLMTQGYYISVPSYLNVLKKYEIKGTELLFIEALKGMCAYHISKVSEYETPGGKVTQFFTALKIAVELEQLDSEAAKELIQQIKDGYTANGGNFEEDYARLTTLSSF